MDKAVEHLVDELSRVRTGRASPAIVEKLRFPLWMGGPAGEIASKPIFTRLSPDRSALGSVSGMKKTRRILRGSSAALPERFPCHC